MEYVLKKKVDVTCIFHPPKCEVKGAVMATGKSLKFVADLTHSLSLSFQSWLSHYDKEFFLDSALLHQELMLTCMPRCNHIKDTEDES